MSKYKKQHVGKIGYCDNSTLGLRDRNGRTLRGGHYVYIRKVNGARCDVNVITSLEDKNQRPDLNKIRHVKNGNTYAIPKYDANFKQWSGITHKPIRDIPLSKIQDIGKKQIKRKHKFYVGKFFK